MYKKPFVLVSKWLIAGLLLLVFLVAASVYISDRAVSSEAIGSLYNHVREVPPMKTALVLGTSKYIRSGRINWYYKHRIEATFQLWKAKKIRTILVSGDNGMVEYNEPETFRQDLIALGVDSQSIFLDYAGFRTFDSVVRAKEVFGQDSVCLVSQKFHNERALYIARRVGVYAIGFNARDVESAYGFKTNLREKFARLKVRLDFQWNTKPKFLGEKISLP